MGHQLSILQLHCEVCGDTCGHESCSDHCAELLSLRRAAMVGTPGHGPRLECCGERAGSSACGLCEHYACGGLSDAEVASALGMTVDDVVSTQNRAIERIQNGR